MRGHVTRGGEGVTRDEAAAVLGVEAGNSEAEVRAAYRELAQMLHPDKYGDNKRLRSRAERQMRAVNEARDVLLGKSGASCATRSRTGSASAADPESIAFEATARARAAEVARLGVAAQLRTLVERRHGVATLLGISLLAALVCSRLRGTVGALGFSVSSMLLVWSAVDTVSLGNRIGVLRRRSLELTRTRDRANDIAQQAREL